MEEVWGEVQLTLYNVLSHQSDSGLKEAVVDFGPVGADAGSPASSQVVA